MRLELGEIKIQDIQFADKSEIKNGVLYVSKAELEEVSEVANDDYLKSIEFFIARPGDSTRIIPV